MRVHLTVVADVDIAPPLEHERTHHERTVSKRRQPGWPLTQEEPLDCYEQRPDQLPKLVRYSTFLSQINATIFGPPIVVGVLVWTANDRQSRVFLAYLARKIRVIEHCVRLRPSVIEQVRLAQSDGLTGT